MTHAPLADVALLKAVLNVATASFVAALLVAFVNPERAGESVARIRRRSGRWRAGMASSLAGTVVLAPVQGEGAFTEAVAATVLFAGYGLVLWGLFLMAGATWDRPWPRVRGTGDDGGSGA